MTGSDIYDPENETWEFIPGDLVKVEETNLSGSMVLVAKEKVTGKKYE